MGLLSKLKSLLGAGDGDRSAGSGVDVTVERDPSTDAEQADEPTTTDDEPTDTDAGAATEAEHPADPSEADEEPAVEEAEPETEDESETEDEPEADVEEAEPDVEEAEAETEADAAEEDAEPADDGEPVTDLDGIGPAYAERLENAGVSTVAELAAADPEELAEQIDLSAKRVGRWVDSANDRS
ncbi:helix-hairpin-helix domain-containing protein [Halobacterium wangiae]|uniref:helix-hairpin-helix domain-containing protein n=1 Tax=Halobacterium wangiae TaxID=2902623 RepID=UPI001E5BB7A1|nr:helix-hairpin-helix domain-containing protein [Halobacterium wangiae]